MELTKSAQNTVLSDEVSSRHSFEVVDETDEVSYHIYGKATLTKVLR
ncbi:hypothetical protein [Streptococcus pneumoniae]|nr:hypothetical protein [Streptococcus pneumoniae]